MNKSVWIQATVIPLVVIGASLALFFGIAVFLEILHDYALAIGTVLFIGISAGAWLLARRTERAHAAEHPDQASDGI